MAFRVRRHLGRGYNLKLSMIEFDVVDIEASTQWFVAVLNCQLLKFDPIGQFALLSTGTARLAFKKRNEATKGVNLAFEVAHLESERRRLTDLGIEAESVVAVPEEQYRRLSFHSPEGWKITFFQWD